VVKLAVIRKNNAINQVLTFISWPLRTGFSKNLLNLQNKITPLDFNLGKLWQRKKLQ